MNGVRCDKLATAAVAAFVTQDINKKAPTAAVAAFVTQDIKKAPIPSLKVASVAQTRPAKWQRTSAIHVTFKWMIKLKKYSKEEYDSMLSHHQQLYELQKKARLMKGKKIPESSRALKARVAMLEAKTDNSSNEHI